MTIVCNKEKKIRALYHLFMFKFKKKKIQFDDNNLIDYYNELRSAFNYACILRKKKSNALYMYSYNSLFYPFFSF